MLKRYSTLKRKKPLSRGKGFTRKKNPATGRIRGLARVSKSPMAKLKRELWAITRQIVIKLHGTNCFTCPSKSLFKSNLHVGHFIPSSVCSAALRYDLENLRPQCYACNIHRSGNWPEYEKHLKEDGIDVAELKRRNQATKGKQYDRLWYEAKIAEYKAHYETIRGVETKEVMGSK